MARYTNPAMSELAAQQMRYAPHEVRLQQIERAETLLESIDAKQSYPYQDICQQITEYRPERFPDLTLSGRDAARDVRCFVEDLSDSIDLDAAKMDEPVLTVNEVSRQYNVSTKTVDRWRNRGLASRRFLFDGRKRVGFLKSTVERYVAKHGEEVQRGTRFSQLTDSEKEDIVRRARRLARHGGCPSEVSRRIARKLNRSPETIRYTVRNYDRHNPGTAVFPNVTEPLTEAKKLNMYKQFRRGMSVDDLARRHCRTRASVYRIVSDVRAVQLLEQPIDYMDSEEFHDKGAEKMILGPPPEREVKARAVKAPPGLPAYLASLYTVPLLTREEEAYYFRKMNFLKFRAATVRDSINRNRPSAKQMDTVEKLLDQAVQVKNFLIRSNLRLVVSIAKKHVKPGANFFEMVSDGNMSLIRAIEKFKYTLGNKFSTYATWAIMKNFARSIPAEHIQLDRFRTGHDEMFSGSRDDRANQFHQELVNQTQHSLIMSILDRLDNREKDIILHRFGLEQGTEPETLEQVGNRLGVTKERIRQLESRALRKLRKIAQVEKLDIPGV
jgi:RNA polymerase sigma factor (sigma-70 family)